MGDTGYLFFNFVCYFPVQNGGFNLKPSLSLRSSCFMFVKALPRPRMQLEFIICVGETYMVPTTYLGVTNASRDIPPIFWSSAL